MKTGKKILVLAAFSLTLIFSALPKAYSHQGDVQMGGGFGLFTGAGTAFDVDLEPEYFFADNMTISFRFDLTAGDLDSVQFGSRFRYYFDLPRTDSLKLFAGIGAGAIVDFNGDVAGDIAIPVFGAQYNITDNFSIGPDFSFDIVFDNNNSDFAVRLMFIQLKYRF